MESPPGGWEYTVPETGLTIKAPLAKILKGRVKAHLEANGFPVPEPWDVWFEDALCRQSQKGPPWCGKDTPVVSEQVKLLTSGKVERFVKTVIQALKDKKFVSHEEAQRRADICAACPMATSVGMCFGCSSIMSAATRALRGREVVLPKDKTVCSACGCWISAKALLDNETLNKAEGSNRPPYAEGCWRLQ